jgi:uncharacterized ion transporter superfamily protein YfcC
MNLFIIITAIAIVAVVLLYIGSKNAYEIKEEEIPKYQHEVRKVTFVVSETDKPKKKKKKYYNKKKATLAESATPVAKRPVGRPRKTIE